LYGRNRFNKVLNLTPKIHSNSPPFKKEGGKGGMGKERREKEGREGEGASPNKILLLQHWKYPFVPMAT
jgi:hypothetical protein